MRNATHAWRNGVAGISTKKSTGTITGKWKWCTSAYWRTKIGGIQCKISLKKRGSLGVGSKKIGSFCEKMGVI